MNIGPSISGVIIDSLWHAIGEHTQSCEYLWGEIWAC